MSDNTNLVAKSNAGNSSSEKLSLAEKMQQAPRAVVYSADNVANNAHANTQDNTLANTQDNTLASASSINLALGYYAVGELSIGRPENALYAYRLLNELEKNEMRWQLGKAFCALELNLLAEAQEALDYIQKIAPQNSEPEQQKLLERCTLRLEYMQKRQKINHESNLDAQNSNEKKKQKKQKNSGEIIDEVTQEKIMQDEVTQGKVIPFPAAQTGAKAGA